MTEPATTGTAVAPKVLRFTLLERGLHWALALPLLTATSTGLLLGAGDRIGISVNHFGTRRVHIISGLVVVALPATILLVGRLTDQGRLRTTLRSLFGHRALTRPSAFSPPRFSAGQQVFAGLVVAGLILGLVSGVELWQWHWFPLAARRGALALHQLLGYGFALAIAGHVYLAAVHPTTRWTLPGIVTGFVSSTRATQHAANGPPDS